MIPRIIAYRTRHFEFRVPIDEWNEKKIPLPEGAGAQFIAPSDLTAILLEPFYYDWSYETDGRITGEPPVLVYGEEWVGKEIRHFPWCKELFEFLDCLKKQYGWTITESWKPIVDGLRELLLDEAIRRGRMIAPEEALGYDPSILGRAGLAFSGYVLGGKLWDVGDYGYFWSASEISASSAWYLDFSKVYVYPAYDGYRYYAQSVRCVA